MQGEAPVAKFSSLSSSKITSGGDVFSLFFCNVLADWGKPEGAVLIKPLGYNPGIFHQVI